MDIIRGESNGKQIKCERCERTIFLKSLGKCITNCDTYEYPTGWLLERDGINGNKIYGDSTSTYSFHWICPRCAIQQGFKAIEKEEGTQKARDYMELYI